MKRSLLAVMIVGLVGWAAFKLSSAYFADEEISSDNAFTAGAVDLVVKNTSYYLGLFNEETSWEANDLSDGNGETEGDYRFIDFDDIKPGDWGEDVMGIRVDTNDAWVCAEAVITSNDDMDCTGPELVDDTSCVINDDLLDGELADEVEMVVWVDDGDGVLEELEAVIGQGLINEVISGFELALADSVSSLFSPTPVPLAGETWYYLGKAWCFGEMVVTPLPQEVEGNPETRGSGILCNGSGLNNATQTDVVTADITLSAVQSRNNLNFVCPQSMPTPSPTASPTPTEARAWINEIHYDNIGDDTDEGIEIAGTAGIDLTGWSLVLYNGANGLSYHTIPLSVVVDTEDGGYGFEWIGVSRDWLQNGPSDGLALVDNEVNVIQFLSYEGSLAAVNGPAVGMIATDIGVSEGSSTPMGQSLQLTGSGNEYDDFSWSGPIDHTKGDINTGQTMN